MILEKDCDLLTANLDAIAHFCNCQCVMGGGLAAKIKKTYPEAYLADQKTKCGDREKLGTFSYAILSSNKHIINCYTQYGYGYGTRQTSYDAVVDSLSAVKTFLIENGLLTFGLPKNAGCRLGGGSWPVVRAIIGDLFDNSPIELTICNYD